MRRQLAVAALTALVLAPQPFVGAREFGTAVEPSQTRRPNVVLIIGDDLGYGDLGSYGAPDVRTPNLDRLAREGVRLTQFYANAPVCTPTRAALITGRYQQRVSLEKPLGTKEGLMQGLPVTGRSLPQLLKQAGYATALIGKWHLGFAPEFHPNRHGFDYFWGFLAGYVDWYTHARGDGQADLWENATPVTHPGYLSHEVTKRAAAFVASHASEPFFLEVALGAPHWPFQSPERSSVAERKNDSMVQAPADPDAPSREDYARIVEDLDNGVGEILDALRKQSLAENTLVVFMSDNGGEWLSRNAPFFHRKNTLWEGGIRVPAIFRWPAVIPAGKTLSQVGITMDVTATVLTAAGAMPPGGGGLEGIDLLPILRESSTPVDRTLFWRNASGGGGQRAVRSGDWKLLIDGEQQLLFDVTRDPGERDDQAARSRDRVQKFKQLLDAWERDVDAEAKSRVSRPR